MKHIPISFVKYFPDYLFFIYKYIFLFLLKKKILLF